MRQHLFLLLLWVSGVCSAQESSIMNQGASQQSNYYTELSYDNVRDKIIVEARIGSRHCRFIVDTGAPTMVSASLYEELTLATLERLPIEDANGRTDSLTVAKLPAISLGDVSFIDIPVLVANDSFLFDCYQIDGFIGSNLLRNSIIRLLPKERKIILTDQPQRVQVDKKQALPMLLNKAQSSPYITLRAKGAKSASITVLFDLGMEGLFDLALNHYAALEREGIFTVMAKTRGSSSLGLHGRGQDTLQYRLALPQLMLNKASLQHVLVHTTVSQNSRLGAGLLAYGSVTLDYMNRKFYFDPFQSSNVLSEKLFPVAITLRSNMFVVAAVWSDELRDKLQVNDQVLAIDGVDYSIVDPCMFLTGEKLFTGKSQAAITVKKSNGSIASVLVSRR